MQTNKMPIEYVKDTFPEYLSKTGYIAASDIKNFLRSPKYYYYERFEKIPTVGIDRHFLIGSGLHEIILEPELFKTNYAVCPDVDRRTKQGKEDYAKFVETAVGKTVLFQNEMDMIVQMAENATKNKVLVELMKDSYREVSCYTTDEKTGLKLRMRPDSMAKTKSTITDIKSCIDSSPRKFKSDVYSYGYSISGAYYMDFLNRENYVFAAIEKQEPYQASLFMLSDEMIEYGRTQYRMGLDLLKWSYENKFWADYNEFELLKECYELGSLDEFFDTLDKSELITILK